MSKKHSGGRKHAREEPTAASEEAEEGAPPTAIRTTRKREPDSPTPETPTSQHQHLGFVYEHARTGRSICRKCNTTIAVDTPRAGFDVIMTRAAFGHRGRVWYHADCIHTPAGMHMDHFIADAADRPAAREILRRVQAEESSRGAGDAAAAEPEPKHQKRHPELVAVRGVKGRHAAAEQAIAHAHPGDPRFELTRSPPRDAAHEMRLKYAAMSVAELQECLRANKQLVGGSHAALVSRCIDGEMHGALPACPRCHVARLHFFEGRYICPGYFDSTGSVVVRCPFEAETVERKPWVMPGGETQAGPGLP